MSGLSDYSGSFLKFDVNLDTATAELGLRIFIPGVLKHLLEDFFFSFDGTRTTATDDFFRV